MHFRTRVSFRDALNYPGRVHDEMAAHNALAIAQYGAQRYHPASASVYFELTMHKAPTAGFTELHHAAATTEPRPSTCLSRADLPISGRLSMETRTTCDVLELRFQHKASEPYCGDKR